MPTSARSRACTNFLVIRRGGRLCPPADIAPHPRQGTRAPPYKMLGCRAGPMCPAAQAFFDFATSTAAADLVKNAGAVPVAK